MTNMDFRERLMSFVQRFNIYTPKNLYAVLRSDPAISAFVDRYYAEDFAVYAAAKAGNLSRNIGRPELGLSA
jgi:hypothetical protein